MLGFWYQLNQELDAYGTSFEFFPGDSANGIGSAYNRATDKLLVFTKFCRSWYLQCWSNHQFV